MQIHCRHFFTFFFGRCAGQSYSFASLISHSLRTTSSLRSSPGPFSNSEWISCSSGAVFSWVLQESYLYFIIFHPYFAYASTDLFMKVVIFVVHLLRFLGGGPHDCAGGLGQLGDEKGQTPWGLYNLVTFWHQIWSQKGHGQIHFCEPKGLKLNDGGGTLSSQADDNGSGTIDFDQFRSAALSTKLGKVCHGIRSHKETRSIDQHSGLHGAKSSS